MAKSIVLELGITSTIDFAHPARTDFLGELIVANRPADHDLRFPLLG